ncbi:hypothetical protein [Streptomyces flaveolus]|uniref:hypothetical protein n=1 Tax=Streptomyces flaveolus TaxID=67297 RepID=UPI0033E0F4AB
MAVAHGDLLRDDVSATPHDERGGEMRIDVWRGAAGLLLVWQDSQQVAAETFLIRCQFPGSGPGVETRNRGVDRW